MQYIVFLISLGFIATLMGCTSEHSSTTLESAIKHNSEHMAVTYQVVSNTEELPCIKEESAGECYASQLQLKFSQALPATGWEIVFSHLSPIQSHDGEFFEIKHINGDLHRLIPLKSVAADQAFTINLQSGFWSVSKTDVLPNYFFAYDDGKTSIISATREVFTEGNAIPSILHAGTFTSPNQIKRNKHDQSSLATAAQLFERNQAILKAPLEESNLFVVPSIKQAHVTSQWVDAKKGLAVNNIDKEKYLAAWRLIEGSNISLNKQGVPLEIVTNALTSSIPEQGYSLNITPEKITINARDNTGVFYALMSINQLINDNYQLPVGGFSDSPRFNFRGVHLDVARNFRSVNFVKSLIKQMAHLKLNKLHLHLADDEGWRLEIKGLEELTTVGGYRCYDPSETQCLITQLGSGPNRDNSANGFYSQEDYQHLLQFADAHHVEIIPSLDMPGHSRAAIKSMESRYRQLYQAEKYDAANEFLLTDFKDTTQYSSVQHYNDNTLNPCLDSTYRFVDKVLSNLINQHKKAGVPMKRYHIGADETAGAWHESPACEAFIKNTPSVHSVEDLGGYFVSKVAQMVQSKGIIAGGWSDGMREFTPEVTKPMQVNVWDLLVAGGHEASNTFSQQGWHTILSYPDVLYFDFPYAVDPHEPGYYWASRATDSYKVFQFMPQTPEQNARLWNDRMNKPYGAKSITNADTSFEGIQAHLWTEVVRHDTVAQYMYYPRLLSFAQKAWVANSWEKSASTQTNNQLNHDINTAWRQFSQALVRKQLPRLAAQDIQFRIPPPGASVLENMLHMNHLYEGMTLQYQNNLGHWTTYTKPVIATDLTKVRAVLPNTDRTSVALNIHH